MNHIQKILDELDTTPETAGSAIWKRLTIRAICAVAQELRVISNEMSIGQPDDLPPRIPAEAGEMARQLDEALSEVAPESHGCTQPRWLRLNSNTYSACTHCPDADDCKDYAPF